MTRCFRYTHWFWDKIVFKNTKAILGGRCRLMVTGSAPIAGNVMDLLRIAMCCPLVEGYGQTECGAAATITQLGDTSTGHVGGPMPCNDVKLCDVPEMNYVTNNPGGNPRGEVCFRGPNVFSGYFKVSPPPTPSRRCAILLQMPLLTLLPQGRGAHSRGARR